MRLILLLSSLLMLCARFAAPQSIWTLTPEQRQAVLAEQAREAQLNQQREIQKQSQIQAAQQAQAVEAARAAQMQLQATQQNIATANAVANTAMATLEASAQQQRTRSEQANLEDRARAATAALRQWHPGQSYVAARASNPHLRDPFTADEALKPLNSELRLAKLLEGSCLYVDTDHGVARVGANCQWPGVSANSIEHLYPVLADGSLLDSAEHVQQFLALAKDPNSKIWFLRGEGALQCFR